MSAYRTSESHKMKNILALAIASLLLWGCVTSGTNFKKLNDTQISLGTTNSITIREKLGRPTHTGAVIKNEHRLEMMSFAFADVGGTGTTKDVTPARAQTFYFLEEKLVGIEFSSSWAVDTTDFDETKITQIKTNQTKIGELDNLLGAAQGDYIFPMVKSDEDQGKVYKYSQVTGGAFNMRAYTKHLIISYNKKTGIVTNVDYKETGER